jgi:hypothetical protein
VADAEQELLEFLRREQDDMIKRMNDDMMRRLYPAERVIQIAAQAYPFCGTGAARKPSLRQRLRWLVYKARARLASWILGRDVDADDGEDL